MQHKLKTGEMTSEECRAVLKELMLREFDRKQAEQSHNARKALVTKLQNRAQSFFKKFLDRRRVPAEPSINGEELAGSIRAEDLTDSSRLPAISRHHFSARPVSTSKSLAQ